MIAHPGISRAPANRLVQSKTGAGEDLSLPFVQVDLNSIAIELDLMKPMVALGRSGFKGGELGLNESRHHRFLGRQSTSTRAFGHYFLRKTY
jgi:hypothetical protein